MQKESMEEPLEPLQTRAEVETAVLISALPDTEFDLGRGAGLLTDPTQYFLINRARQKPKPRVVVGLTALSLDASSAHATFRTATFGVKKPESIASLDALGTSQIIDQGVSADRHPKKTKITNSSLGRAAFGDVHGPLGGVVMYTVEDNKVATVPFLSESYMTFARGLCKTRTSRVVSALMSLVTAPKEREARDRAAQHGIDRITLQAIGVYATLLNRAQKRGGPVVVERPFVARF